MIGFNIVRKCDITLSRAIQSLTSDVLRVLFFPAYFTISVFDDTYWMKSTCCWRRQLEGAKPVEAKIRVNDYETCENEE